MLNDLNVDGQKKQQQQTTATAAATTTAAGNKKWAITSQNHVSMNKTDTKQRQQTPLPSLTTNLAKRYISAGRGPVWRFDFCIGNGVAVCHLLPSLWFVMLCQCVCQTLEQPVRQTDRQTARQAGSRWMRINLNTRLVLDYNSAFYYASFSMGAPLEKQDAD